MTIKQLKNIIDHLQDDMQVLILASRWQNSGNPAQLTEPVCAELTVKKNEVSSDFLQRDEGEYELSRSSTQKAFIIYDVVEELDEYHLAP